MKLLFIYYKYPRYQHGSYFQEFINKIAQSLAEVYLLATRYPKGKFKKPKNIKILWVPRLNIRFLDELFFMMAVLFKAIFTKELHQIHLVNSIGPRGLLAGWYLRKRYAIPLVCTIEMLNEGKGMINTAVYWLSRWLITRSPIDKIICWSNYYWQNHLKEWGIPEEKVAIIPAGIDIKAYHPDVDGGEIKKKHAPNNPLIVFAKPLYSTNTQAAKLLLESIALLKSEMKIKLLIGSGEGRREVQDLAEDLGIADQVDFMPLIPFPDILKYIAASDLIVLPFTQPATTSRSLLEAMAMGKPIITTNLGEVKNIVEDKKDVFLVQPDPKEIADAIKTVLKNKKLSYRLGAAAVRLIRKKFALPTVVNQTMAVFKEVI